MEQNGMVPAGGGQPAEREQQERVIRCELTMERGEGCGVAMDEQQLGRFVHALRAIETKLGEVADKTMHGPFGANATTDAGHAYFVGQLNGIRANLAAADPTVGLLFPEAPADLAPIEVAAIAGQLAEYLEAELGQAGRDVSATVTCDTEAPKSTGEGAPTTGPMNISIEIGDGVIFGDAGQEGLASLIKQAMSAFTAAMPKPPCEVKVETE
jgi:hypothetical protein